MKIFCGAEGIPLYPVSDVSAEGLETSEVNRLRHRARVAVMSLSAGWRTVSSQMETVARS